MIDIQLKVRAITEHFIAFFLIYIFIMFYVVYIMFAPTCHVGEDTEPQIALEGCAISV